MFSQGRGGEGNSQGKHIPKLLKVSRTEYYHQLHSSGSIELPTAKVKHICTRD